MKKVKVKKDNEVKEVAKEVAEILIKRHGYTKVTK